MTLARNPYYWGRDLPINRGFWNFDEIRFDYYRDANSHHRSLQERPVTMCGRKPTRRAGRRGYDFPAMQDGRVVKETFTDRPAETELQFFVFNTRRPVFADMRVREAIALLFDFAWINQEYLSSASIAAARVISTARSCRPMAGRPTRGSAPCSPPFPMRCAPTCSTAPGPRPSATAPGATAPTLRRALALFDGGGLRTARH